MASTRVSGSRRREDSWVRWAEHLAAQRNSGQNQAAYCRDRGLDSKYFSVWKRKLGSRQAKSSAGEPPRLVPVVVRSEPVRTAAQPRSANASHATAAVQINLGNGMSLSVQLAIGVLGALVRELASA